MIYLAICILAGATSPQLLRFSQEGRHSPSAIAMLAYGCGAVYTLIVLVCGAGSWSPIAHPAMLTLGVISGLSGFGGVLIGLECFRRAGVAVSVTIGSLSVVVATVLAWFIWDDPMHVPKWIGLALMPLAVALLRPVGKESVRQTWLTALFLLLSVVMGVVTMTAHKAASEYGPQDYELGYQLVGFGTATLAGFAHLAWQRRLPGRRDLGVGSAVGVCYAVSQLSMMHALNMLPATLIYPTMGTSGVALNVILARQLWRERLLRRQVVGVAMAVLVVLLMNLGRSGSGPGQPRKPPAALLDLPDVARGGRASSVCCSGAIIVYHRCARTGGPCPRGQWRRSAFTTKSAKAAKGRGPAEGNCTG